LTKLIIFQRVHPVEYTITKNNKKSIPATTSIPLDVDEEVAKKEIQLILDKKGAYELSPEEISHKVSDAVERWKLKIKLSVAILKKVLVEGSENVRKELFQALFAVNTTEKLESKDVSAEDGTELLTYLIQKLRTSDDVGTIASDDASTLNQSENRSCKYKD
jgi:hypothetical protein